MKNELLPIAAMARRLGVPVAELRKAAESGDVPSVRLGDALVFNSCAVKESLLARAKGDSNAS